MSKFLLRDTSVSFVDRLTIFINERINPGRCNSASHVVRTRLRLLEESEVKVGAMRGSLMESEDFDQAAKSVGDAPTIRWKFKRAALSKGKCLPPRFNALP